MKRGAVKSETKRERETEQISQEAFQEADTDVEIQSTPKHTIVQGAQLKTGEKRIATYLERGNTMLRGSIRCRDARQAHTDAHTHIRTDV